MRTERTIEQADQWILNFVNMYGYRPTKSSSKEAASWSNWLSIHCSSSLRKRCERLGIEAGIGQTYKDFQWQDVYPYIWALDSFEKKIIRHLVTDRWTQVRLAEELDMSQAAISYRVKKITQRLQTARMIPKLTDQAFTARIESYLGPEDVEIVRAARKGGGHQSNVAKELGLTQGRVRYHLQGALAILSEASDIDPSLQPHVEILRRVVKGELRRTSNPWKSSRIGVKA